MKQTTAIRVVRTTYAMAGPSLRSYCRSGWSPLSYTFAPVLLLSYRMIRYAAHELNFTQTAECCHLSKLPFCTVRCAGRSWYFGTRASEDGFLTGLLKRRAGGRQPSRACRARQKQLSLTGIGSKHSCSRLLLTQTKQIKALFALVKHLSQQAEGSSWGCMASAGKARGGHVPGHATTRNAACTRQARQKRLSPTETGSRKTSASFAELHRCPQQQDGAGQAAIVEDALPS